MALATLVPVEPGGQNTPAQRAERRLRHFQGLNDLLVIRVWRVLPARLARGWLRLELNYVVPASGLLRSEGIQSERDERSVDATHDAQEGQAHAPGPQAAGGRPMLMMPPWRSRRWCRSNRGSGKPVVARVPKIWRSTTRRLTTPRWSAIEKSSLSARQALLGMHPLGPRCGLGSRRVGSSARHGYWMRKWRVLESRICKGNGGFAAKSARPRLDRSIHARSLGGSIGVGNQLPKESGF